MRLLYVTYKVDAHDTLVGYVAGWINGLAAHMERVEVICLAAGEADLASNVRIHSLGKERSSGRFTRAVLFYRTLWGLRAAVDAVFCQFSPEYVLAVAPLAKIKRWPVALWYTHRHVSWRLRLAATLADCILTASPESFGLPTSKLRVIGHGIDTERFSPNPDRPLRTTPPIILAVGRRAPIKNYELLIDATAVLVHEYGASDIEVRIVGGDEGNAPPGYAQSLQARIERHGLSGKVKLVGPVVYSQIAPEFRAAAVAVNLCPTGGMDKAVLEGMAAGVPTLVRNTTFQPVFGADADRLVLPEADAQAVALRLDELLQLPEDARRSLGERLRRKAVENFSQQALVNRLGDELLRLRR